MDDLSGLNWTSSTATTGGQKPPPMSTGSYYPTLRPTPPLSGRSTPLSTLPNKPSASGIARSNASTPVNDSFANLVSFNAASSIKGLTLQEQQQRLQEEKAHQRVGIKGPASGQQDEVFWEKLGSGTSTPNPVIAPPTFTTKKTDDIRGAPMKGREPAIRADIGQSKPSTGLATSNDLLADFDTPYRSSTSRNDAWDVKHEVQSSGEHGMGSILKEQNTVDNEDEDPFGLGSMNNKTQLPKVATGKISEPDDDILGMLGRPVSDFSRPKQQSPPSTLREETSSSLPADRALAELVEMGFTAEKSRQALEATGSGSDVQSAVGWLLNQAHQESRSQSRGRQQDGSAGHQQVRRSPPRKSSTTSQNLQPAWMNSTAAGKAGRPNSRSPVNGDRDPSQRAAELGNNLFKTANSIWKTGTKKLNQAVAELNSDSDSSQPKWMRETRVGSDTPAVKPQHQKDRMTNGHQAKKISSREPASTDPGVTDEALMLESADTRPVPRKPFQSKPDSPFRETRPAMFERPEDSQVDQQDITQPKFMQQVRSQERQDPRSRLSKQAVEEQTAEAYISPARRKKNTPKPAAFEANLLFEASPMPSASSIPPSNNKRPPRQQPINQSTRPPPQNRPQPPKRVIPTLPPTVLQTSHSSRHAGTQAFRRGDYAEATAHYTSALAPIPSNHPLLIPILTNRALSHLKTGDPKQSIADTTTALDIIGPSRGVGETLDLGEEGGPKDMHTYWIKAMTRQAEALEQLEKWADAGVVWKICVEAGVGGATSIAGRDRCEKFVNGRRNAAAAAAIAKKPLPSAKPKLKPQLKSSALEDLAGASSPQSTTADTEAVSRLRAANLAAERLDDEKFALADHVSDRVSKWRGGKEGNLRALLASLDAVLWEGSGWKKVGMGELIVGGKVKVVYMKAVGRCHPDKLPITATTEQRMISAAVFATLNEAWDGFKRENGL
ncbi:MAG: hypothetical protein Q9220_005518 [cf. Caloplaca sp. 1 TL-2023]